MIYIENWTLLQLLSNVGSEGQGMLNECQKIEL